MGRGIFPAKGVAVAVVAALALSLTALPLSGESEPRRNIMLTGFWNPTGKMISGFSTNKWLNPGGWQGGDWEGRGYDIHSFFPAPDVYNGTFEVDYQQVSKDFWNIADAIKPVAIISFGAGNGPWELEYNARNLNTWYGDGTVPTQPTPSPPDGSKSEGFVRHSSLPVQAIADAVNASTSIDAWVDWKGDPGAYLCEYMAYHDGWYQALHNGTSDQYRCLAAGFIHVNNTISVPDAGNAAKITLRCITDYLDGIVPETNTAVVIPVLSIILLAVLQCTVRRERNRVSG